MIHFWADTHFNHQNQAERRDFASVEEMNAELIRRWNAAVRPSDTIALIGDFGFHRKGAEPLEDIFARLNGQKHLVIGNHDQKHVLRLGWVTQSAISTVKQDGMRAELCHYPIESWKKMHRGALMLHGHSHGNLAHKINRRFDVSVECTAGPRRFEDLWAQGQAEAFEATDHHVEKEIVNASLLNHMIRGFSVPRHFIDEVRVRGWAVDHLPPPPCPICHARTARLRRDLLPGLPPPRLCIAHLAAAQRSAAARPVTL